MITKATLEDQHRFFFLLLYTHNTYNCTCTYTYTNIRGNIVNNNDDFTERTNKNIISHTLFSKVLILVVCERWLETRTDCYIDPKFFWLLQHFFLILAGVAQPWATEGPKPSVCRWVSIRHLLSDWLQLARAVSGTLLYNCLTSTCFRCSSAYLHRCISWLTARWSVNMLHYLLMFGSTVWENLEVPADWKEAYESS